MYISGFFTTSSVKLYRFCLQIFVYNCFFREMEKQHSQNFSHSQGRNSTPLHLAAGYNNLEVAEFLLENGADVNAQDKGGLIPLHNASSYGHLDIAALLIRYL